MTRMGRLLLGLMASTTLITTEATASDPVFYVRSGSTAPFSPAVRVGDLIFLSGQIGAAPDGGIPSAMADQARLAMDNVGAALKLAGADFGDVIKCTVMLTDMQQWANFNKVYVGYFAPGRLPTRSAMGVSGLALGAGVEVECIAYKPAAVAK